MDRIAASLALVWALLGAPAVCRAGVLDACCEAPASLTASCCPASCDDCRDDCPPEHGAAPRDCGVCASTCNAVVKAGDKSSDLDRLQQLPADLPPLLALHRTGAPHLRAPCQPRPPGPCLPFSESDVPLLI